MVVNGKDRETLQMGMKTENIEFKTPKIYPQSYPNKFGGEKRLKITWRSSEWWSPTEKLHEKLVRDETIRLCAFRVEKTQKLTLELRGQTLLNVVAEGVRC